MYGIQGTKPECYRAETLSGNMHSVPLVLAEMKLLLCTTSDVEIRL